MAAFALVAVAGMSVMSSASGLVGLWFATSGSDAESVASEVSGALSQSTSSAPASKTCDSPACDAAMKAAVETDSDFSTSTLSACSGCPSRTFVYNEDNTVRVLKKSGCADLVTPASMPASERQQAWVDYLSASNTSCSSPQTSSGATLTPVLTKSGCAAAIEKKMKEGLDGSCGSCSGGDTCWNDFSSLPECAGCGGGSNSFGMCYGGDGKPAWFKKTNKTNGEITDDTKSFSTKSASDLKWSKWFMENGYLETCSASTTVASAQSGKTRTSSRKTSSTKAPAKKTATSVPYKRR